MAEPGKACVFSEVNGRILFNGEPAANAVVTRLYEHGSIVSEETLTNANGEFSFTAAYKNALSGLLSIEFVVAQRMSVSFQDEEFLIWSNTKRSKKEYSELGGRPLMLSCELTENLSIFRDFGSILRTNCTWPGRG